MTQCPHCHKAISIRIISGNDEEGLPENDQPSSSQCRKCGETIYWHSSKTKRKPDGTPVKFCTNSPLDRRDWHNCEG